MQQLAYEFVEFAEHAVKSHDGTRALNLISRFVGACQATVALKVRRFTRNKALPKQIRTAEQKLQLAARELLTVFPEDACEVVVIVLASEDPRDDHIADFIHALAKFKPNE